jgi:hypothetical protein
MIVLVPSLFPIEGREGGGGEGRIENNGYRIRNKIDGDLCYHEMEYRLASLLLRRKANVLMSW